MDKPNENVEDFLKHYGVLGMKWGVRKRKVPVQNNHPPRQRRMSNKELNARIKRLKLEQEYAKLTAKPEIPSKIQRAIEVAGTVAAISGTAITIYKNMNELSKAVKKVS